MGLYGPLVGLRGLATLKEKFSEKAKEYRVASLLKKLINVE